MSGKLPLGALCLAAVLALPVAAADPSESLALKDKIETVADGRAPIETLYAAYLSLLDRGWLLDVVAVSQPEGQAVALPIVALRTLRAGPAVWILSGIHGEEPAGPNAIAATIDAIGDLGERRAVVLLPLNNPHGYVRNWRYLNVATWSAEIDGHSVGDSSHLLPDSAGSDNARTPTASSAEADAVTAYILRLATEYPPSHSIDLHEDSLISEGYVYSQGLLGASDPLAGLAVRALQENGIALKLDGETRFGELISNGVIGPVEDSSIDELMSAATVIVKGQPTPGPGAGTVLVFETPAGHLALPQRVQAHEALLRALTQELTKP